MHSRHASRRDGVFFGYICLNTQRSMMERKTIKIFDSFGQLDQDQLDMNIASTPQARWEAYWKLRRLHRSLFQEVGEDMVYPEATRKIVLSKPMDVEDIEFLNFVKAAA